MLEMDVAKLLSPSQPAEPRRMHRVRRIQTKAGCMVCKTRKVKCGEQKPSCANCIKYRVPCAYKKLTAFDKVPKDQGVQTDFPESFQISHEAISPSVLPTLVFSPFSLLDMELLHHWNHHTYMTTSSDLGVNTLVRQFLPELGFKYPFLLRALLALSAHHLGNLQAAKKEYYASYAAKLHRHAVEGVPPLSTITTENCAAFQLFEAMNCFYSFSPSRRDNDHDTGESVASNEFTMLHRLRAVTYAALGALYNSPVSPMLSYGDKRHVMLIAAVDARAQCKDFDGLWWMILEEEKDPVKLRAYGDTIAIFQATWVVINSSPSGEIESTDLLLGLYNVPVEYIKMLKENDQVALVIFAYAAVALQAVECYWWLQGRGVHLVSEIWKLLDEKHRAWMEWPLEKTGWVPPTCSSTAVSASVSTANCSPFPDMLGY